MADTAEFAIALLQPDLPVPASVKGRPERRYAIYRNNVTIGLMRALEANFPAVRKLLGDVYFSGFARSFAKVHPPRSPLMFEYGNEFPEVLQQEEDLAPYPYLADVARLEILWRKSYHAADLPSLTAEALGSIDPEQLFDCHFVSHPALNLLQSSFAVHSIFAANRAFTAAAVADPLATQSVLITRPLLDVLTFAISPAQYAFFSELQNSSTLNTALDAAIARDENFDLSTALALMLHSGAFHSIQPNTGKP